MDDDEEVALSYLERAKLIDKLRLAQAAIDESLEAFRPALTVKTYDRSRYKREFTALWKRDPELALSVVLKLVDHKLGAREAIGRAKLTPDRLVAVLGLDGEDAEHVREYFSVVMPLPMEPD